jgi:GMP synthase (glutamine-hydrolysing)
MTKILVIDNGGQWTHREWRTLRYLDIEAKIIPNNKPVDEILNENANGLVLSGGSPRIGIEGKLGNCAELLNKSKIPIIGICAGHQFIARHYGGKVEPSKIPEFGKVELTIFEDDPIFNNIAKKSIVWESHNDEVTKIPNKFIHLAKSENCELQIIKHKNKNLYGFQFHPEVEHTEFGIQFFKNFIKICESN